VSELLQQKQQLRDELLACRDGEDASSRAAADARIKAQLESLSLFQDARIVYLYISIGSEVDTRGIIESLLACGKTVCAPRCSSDGVMHAHVLSSLDELQGGVMGIPAPPAGSAVVEPDAIDLIIVPCIACDTSGYRLGYGGGYYDRYLACASQVSSLALCRETQLLERLPREEHDIPVDFVITDKRVLL